MKKRQMSIIAAILSLTMVAGIGTACSPQGDGEAVSYVAVEVNPSVSFTLDRKDRVLSVLADNEDAQVLLQEEEFVGLKADEALEKLAELSVELGYLNEHNLGVTVLVAGKADEDKILAAAERSFRAEAGDLAVNVSKEGTFALDRQLAGVKAEYASVAGVQDMDLVTFRLMLEAQRVDGKLTVSAAAEMDADELIAIVQAGAEELRPYVTAAYRTSVAAAQRIYEDVKGQVLDSIWTVPYWKDLGNIFTGGRKYDVNYGLIYNLYTGSSRALALGIDGAEWAAELAEQTEISPAALEEIKRLLPESQQADFAATVDADQSGTVTLAELDGYFSRYFKNMTAEERAAAQQLYRDLTEEVQAFAMQVDASIAEEYKAAAKRLCKDLADLIPDSISNTADQYMTEFHGMLEDLNAAIEGKEPMAAAYAAKEAIDARAADIMATMREDLTEADLADVEERIAGVEEVLAKAEQAFSDAVAKAEAEANARLTALKEARRQHTAEKNASD